MEFVVTRTETEALLLEANLIKRLRPRFNVLMRDDKSFPYIMLTTDHASPGIFKHRGARSRKSEYFGPFASAGAVGRTINSLQRAFLLRTCTDSVFESRTRPCLLYQIKRCSGPCTGEIGPEDYAELVGEARDFLSGKSQKVKAEISGAMQHAAEELDFERAAVYPRPAGGAVACADASGHQHAGRRRGRRLRHPSGRRADLHPGVLLQDRPELGQPRLFPEGRSGARARRSAELVPRPVLRRQADRRAPSCCRAPSRSRNCWPRRCRTKAGRKISISVPQRGDKKDLTDNALQNAREALGRRLAETSTQGRLFSGFAETFGLHARAAPHRGLRQFAHHGHQCRRRHGRRRARRLRQEPVPQVQHPLDRDHARRRFRHDARGHAAALLPADQGAREAG